MSNEMRGEDTILGTALSRAIESQPIRSTPFERSRVAVRMAGGGRSPLFPVLAAAAAVVLGLALGTTLLGQRGPTDPGGVATQPSPTASPDASAAPTSGPIQVDPNRDRIWVYFARDQLPPVGAYIGGLFEEGDVSRHIQSRIDALQHRVEPGEVPSGTINVVPLIGDEQPGTTGGTQTSVSMSVQIEGDLATVEFGENNFERIRGAAAANALLQQLVYTITEEPGIRRVLLKEKGKQHAEIDQLVVDKPLTREDVLPYEGVKTEERVALEDDPRASTATTSIEDIAGGVRFIIELKANEAPAEGFWSPNVTVESHPLDDRPGTPGFVGPGKAGLDIVLVAATDARSRGGASVVEQTDRSPLRALRITTSAGTTTQATVYNLALDDARPWRVSLEPGVPGTMRLIVDIGGHPQAISESVAVYRPEPGDEVARTFTLTGTARAFEAHVAWRIKDSGDREVATGFVTASLGTSPVWGTFTTEVKIPDDVSGVVTLEVFWPSPRDGADVGRVAIPLRVR